MWDTSEDSELIKVNGHRRLVFNNCFQALQQVRCLGPPDWFWLEAIWINQSGAAEKGDQVSMMHKIFAFASSTTVASSKADDSSRALFQLSNAFEPTDRISNLADQMLFFFK